MQTYTSQSKIRFIAGLSLLCLSSQALPQAQVVDAVDADNRQQPPAQNANPASSTSNNSGTTNAAGNNSDIVITLYSMVESLQREVQILRGLVEEQGFQIRRMEAEQRDRYLDVDNRLSELNQRVSSGTIGTGAALIGSSDLLTPSQLESSAQAALNNNAGQSGSQRTAPVPGSNPVLPSTNNPAPNNNLALNTGSGNTELLTEDELYRQAQNLLLNDGDHEQSITVFQQMIERYPQGRLAPNAYYWQGEALILVQRYSQAINVFNQVIDNFPSHEKAPDSMLKLGVVYSLMGNERRAEDVWSELLSRFAQSGSASLNLAERYLREGYNR